MKASPREPAGRLPAASGKRADRAATNFDPWYFDPSHFDPSHFDPWHSDRRNFDRRSRRRPTARAPRPEPAPQPTAICFSFSSLRFPGCRGSATSLLQIMEARVGIEPTYKGFADLSLTTWVPRRPLHSRSSAVLCLESLAVESRLVEPGLHLDQRTVAFFSRLDLCYNTGDDFDAQFGSRFVRFHGCAGNHRDSTGCSQ